MKHKNLFKTLFAAVMVSLFMPLTANAQIKINEENFPDKNFRNWLSKQDYGTDGELTEAEIQKITKIDVNGENISTLKGIEYFTALEELRCYKSPSIQLKSLDVSQNTALKYLDCYANEITTLDLSNNKALTYLNCGGNQLTSLDLSNNKALTYLDCGNNQLTILDVSNHTELTELICYYNKLTTLYVYQCNLTTLDFYGNPLNFLNCSDNQLTSLDVSKNTALTTLYCGGNQLTSLDVHNNTILTNLGCENNQLTSLDIANNTKLEYLGCRGNQLTSLDVSNNTALTRLICSINQLTNLDVSKNTALRELQCDDNQLTSLDVSNNWNLTLLLCSNNKIKTLDISNNKALTTIKCGYNQLTSLNVNNTALSFLACNDNQLTSLDVSDNIALTELHCFGNQLTSLDISKNIALTRLTCNENQLTSLDVSNNTTLTELLCSNNQLTSLDVSNHTALERFFCHKNQLKSLDISHCTAMTNLDCSNNMLTFFNCSRNNFEGKTMDNLIRNLPQNMTDEIYKFYMYDDSYSDEENVCTSSQIAAVKAKGWTPYYFDINERIWKEYGDRETTTVSIDENGIATYCPIKGYGIDFRNATQIAAYKASLMGEIIMLDRISTVAAGEGVLIRSLNGGAATEDLPIVENATKNEGNAFVGTLEDIVLDAIDEERTHINYVLSKKNDVVGFYQANKTPVAAGKAYLPIEIGGNSGPALVISFNDDNTTGIIEIMPEQATKNDAIYTLSGVRVNNPTKGIYIKNGKKVVIK